MNIGVKELDKQKLGPLLKLKYHAIADAVAELGNPQVIGTVFAEFQQYLQSGFGSKKAFATRISLRIADLERKGTKSRFTF